MPRHNNKHHSNERQHGASEKALDYVNAPAIGRLVLGTEGLEAMLGYIAEHAQKVIRKIPFVPLINEGHYR